MFGHWAVDVTENTLISPARLWESWDTV